MPRVTVAQSVAAHAFLGELARDWPASDPRVTDQASGPQLATSYRGANVDRLNRNWQPQNVSGDAAIYESFPLLTARVRDQIRNEPILKKAAGTLTKHIIGTGIEAYAASLLNVEELDDEHNAQADDLYDHWSEDEADAEGKQAWPEMQGMHFRETVSVGESLLLRCIDPDPSRLSPVCYQLLEAEQLDETKCSGPDAAGHTTVRGIEYDRRNRPVGYWLFLDHPFDPWPGPRAFNSQKIPAARVIHTYMPWRPSDSRGISWFAAIMQSARDTDSLVWNELSASALAALLTVFVPNDDGARTGTGLNPGCDTDEMLNALFRLGRGTIAHGKKDNKPEVIESSRPNKNIAPFVDLLMQLNAMGIEVSNLRLTGDYSQSSYTSARGAHLDDEAFFRPIQIWFGRTVVKPVRREVDASHAALDRFTHVSATQFARQPHRYRQLELQPPGRDQLDPGLETDAGAKRIRYGFSDWDAECGKRGVRFRRTILRQKHQRAFAARHGVPLDLGTNAQTSPTAGNNDASSGDKPQATKQPTNDEADE